MTFLCQHETDTVFVATSANISAEGYRLQKEMILKLKTSPGIPESSPRSIHCLLFPTPTYDEYNSHTV